MRQSWVDQRLEYEHIKEQKKIPEGQSILAVSVQEALKLKKEKVWKIIYFFKSSLWTY